MQFQCYWTLFVFWDTVLLCHLLQKKFHTKLVFYRGLNTYFHKRRKTIKKPSHRRENRSSCNTKKKKKKTFESVILLFLHNCGPNPLCSLLIVFLAYALCQSSYAPMVAIPLNYLISCMKSKEELKRRREGFCGGKQKNFSEKSREF